MIGRRFGILIASSRFPNEPTLEDLRFPENDVDGFNELLASQDYGQFTQTFVFKNKPHHEILRKINQILREADKDDLVLIYYSGHGKLNPVGKLHLTSTDSVINALEATSIPVSIIKDYVDISPSTKIVIILDCCFSGAAGEDFVKSGVDDQLQLVSGGRGAFIMTASTAIQVAKERESDQYGAFTKHVIKGIKSGEADLDCDGTITMNELYRYVHDHVLDEGFQEPMRWDLGVKGKLIIARSNKVPWAKRRKKIRKLLFNLAGDGILPDDILDTARQVIVTEPDNRTEEYKTYDRLLDNLLDDEISVGEYISRWYKIQKEQKELMEIAKKEKKRKEKERLKTMRITEKEKRRKKQWEQNHKAGEEKRREEEELKQKDEKRQGSIEFFCGPSDLGAPDNLESAIINFIDDTRDTLDIAVQELESYNIARAIVRAKQRGVRVRLVLELDYLRSYPASPEPFTIDPSSSLHENREIMAALLRASIDVRVDYNPKIFHQKFVIRDIQEPTRALLTSSTNFTPTGLGTHPDRKNLNHIVVMHNKWIANEYQHEFDEIWNGTFGTRRKRHDETPRNCRVSGIRVRAIFGPDHTPELEMMKQILKAQQRVDFAIFTFSDSSGIDDAMISRARGGLPIRGAFDRMQGNQAWASSHGLRDAGVEIYFTAERHNLGKLHHKLIVIDDRVIVCGSFNYTGPANRLNEENILVIGNLDEDNAQNDIAQKKLAKAVRQEIDRIISTHCG